MRTRKDAYGVLCEILNQSPAERERTIMRVCEIGAQMHRHAIGEVALMMQEGGGGSLPPKMEVPDIVRDRARVQAFFAVFDAFAEQFATGHLAIGEPPLTRYEEFGAGRQVTRLGVGCLLEIANLQQVSFGIERIGEGMWTPDAEYRMVVTEGPLAFLTLATRALLQIGAGETVLNRCPAPEPNETQRQCNRFFVAGMTGGRPRVYCSDSCRQRAHQRRRAHHNE